MKNYLILLFLLTLTACATNVKGYKTTQQVEEQLMIMSGKEIMSVWGKPRYISNTAKGQKKWHYFDQPGDLSSGQCLVDLYVEKNIVIYVDVYSKGRNKLLYPLEPCQNLLNSLPSIIPVEEQ